MSEISAALVKQLRDLTGAPMMDCKRALQETNGDVEAARTLLRERGMAQAAKRADRMTTEGLVGYRLENGRGAMVAVGSESEPVSKNEEFQGFAKKVLEAVVAEEPSAEAVADDPAYEVLSQGEETAEAVEPAEVFEQNEAEVEAEAEAKPVGAEVTEEESA